MTTIHGACCGPSDATNVHRDCPGSWAGWGGDVLVCECSCHEGIALNQRGNGVLSRYDVRTTKASPSRVLGGPQPGLSPPFRLDRKGREAIMTQGHADEHQTSVYRYYDIRSVLLYVGITSRGIARNREHNASKEWWQFVHRQEVEHFATREEALRREADLIRTYRCPFNKVHNPDHAAMRAAYLELAARPEGDEPALLGPLGGTPSTRSARQQVTALSHRLPLKKVGQNGLEVIYAPHKRHRAFAECVNIAGTVIYRDPTAVAELSRRSGVGERVCFVFTKKVERSMPNTITLKVRATKHPHTLWAHEAVAA